MGVVDPCPPAWERLAELAACLRQAVTLTEEIFRDAGPGSDSWQATTLSFLKHTLSQPPLVPGNGPSQTPIADRATFRAHWRGKTCHLGNTNVFRLLERLARRPNQYIPCEVLLDELWDVHTSPDAVRSAVKILRRKLRAAGMEDLAGVIDGSNSHHYGLLLDRLS